MKVIFFISMKILKLLNTVRLLVAGSWNVKNESFCNCKNLV